MAERGGQTVTGLCEPRGNLDLTLWNVLAGNVYRITPPFLAAAADIRPQLVDESPRATGGGWRWFPRALRAAAGLWSPWADLGGSELTHVTASRAPSVHLGRPQSLSMQVSP